MGSTGRFVVVALVLVAMAGSARGADQRPIDRTAAETFVKLQQRDFNALERLAESLRQKNVPLSDGQPSLAGFYAGVSGCVQSGCDDERQPESSWIAHGQLLDEWIRALPGSITARLAKAAYMKEYAWHARGTGYANNVTEHQWRLFYERTTQARSMLEAIRADANNDPHWYATVLSIALVEQWPPDDFEKVFREGTTKFPYYMPMYFRKGSYLSPKWGGTEIAFNKFVEETVQATRRTLGETMYARLHWSGWDTSMFATGRTDWGRMKEGFMRITRDYPDPWNTNNFAKFACLAGDIDTLTEVMARIGDSIIVDAWVDPRILVTCRSKTDRPKKESTVNARAPMPEWSAPEPIWPRPGASFNHFPRTTELEWRAVPGASSYSIEVDCYHCCGVRKWCSDVGKSRITASRIETTSYKFDWVGSNLGRWRVWAVSGNGKESDKSLWQEFLYTR